MAAGWPQHPGDPVTARYEFELQDQRAFSVSRRATSDGGFVIAWRDITEQRATELELAGRRETAYQNEKLAALGQLLAGVAHELNNPLSVVLGHAMMLKEDVTDAESLDSINKISQSAERCAKIVKTFLAMARQKPVQLEQCGLNEIIEMSLEIASYSMRKNGISVQLRLGENLPRIAVDEDQVIQVFINLIMNAEQALNLHSDAPVLQISTIHEKSTDRIIARVSDNGPGITDDLKVRIFEPFYTTKAVGEGTGVGLALSHRIISSHGGELTVADNEMGGATFLVNLPISSVGSDSKADNPVPSLKGTTRVLLVEDEPDVSDMMQKLLSSMDVDVTTASNAEEGLNLLEIDNNYNVILCDLRMPGMGGLGLLHQIESRWPALSDRFAFLTGDAISNDAKTIRNTGRHRLLEKPVSPSELKSLLQTLQSTKDSVVTQEKSS